MAVIFVQAVCYTARHRGEGGSGGSGGVGIF